MNKVITFTQVLDGFTLACPQPSKNFIPEWYKKTKDFTEKNLGPTLNFDKTLLLNTTIKKCVPIEDSIKLGYMIVLDVDVYVDIDKNNKQQFYWPDGLGIDYHSFEQAKKHPKYEKKQDFPRWCLPWIIETSKNYSCLFIPPMHRDNVFEILPAVVDTDKFPMRAIFPFVMKDKKFTGIIPKNTPIAQIIPFKRENWKIKKGNRKNLNEFNKKEYRLNILFLDKYKRLFWQKKNYD
jgi:hypothetical protein